MNSFITRSLSGAVFLCILLAGILLHTHGYAVLMLTIIVLGMHEFYKITLPKNKTLQQSIAYLIGALLFVLFFLEGMDLVSGKAFWILVFPTAALFIIELYTNEIDPFRSISLLVLGIVYIALPFALLNMLTLDGLGNYDHHLLLSFFLFLWANDVGAYCFGMLLGRHGKHKLFERISPKKSWEGFWGGLLASMITASILYWTWGGRYDMGQVHWFVIALIISILGTYGDLIESLLKRSVGVKDSGSIMPGHGGILDRFDGALLAFPCAMAYVQLIRLI